VVVYKAKVKRDEYVFMPKIRRDKETTSEIGGRPFRVMKRAREGVIRGGD
jgi:hypothetical protein